MPAGGLLHAAAACLFGRRLTLLRISSKIPPICAFSHGMDSLDMFEDLGWLMLVIVSAFTLALAWFPR